MKIGWVGVMVCLMILSCTRDWNNPYDSKGTVEPTAPGGLKTVALNDSTVELTWQDSQGEIGYKIERRIDGGPLQEIGSVLQNVTRFADGGLRTGHRYSYRVGAFAANGKEAYTDTTGVQHVFPAPSDLVLTQVSDSEIRLEWKDNSVFESGFRIERKEEGGGFVQVGSVSPNVTSYIDQGLSIGKTYTYRVRVFTSTNESAWVTQSIHHVFPAPSDLVLTQVSDSEIRLEWKDNSVFESGFRIERKEGATGAYVQIATVGPNIQTYTDSDVRLGTMYAYRVHAFTPSNESAALKASLRALSVGETITVANLPGGATIEMVWIEPGTFIMGSPSSESGRDSDEGPQHEVTISRAFWLGKYEITQGQWESVMGTRPWAGKRNVHDNPSHPAVYISWNDVHALIANLDEVEGAEVYRLPTEAEWEYACRAGTTTRWSFGDDESELGRHAWYYDNAFAVGEEYAHAVGTKLPNPWGLYDMHGNVYEWCDDWYDEEYYRSSPNVDPQGPASGSHRVVRGGSFYYYARYVRSADRLLYSPDSRSFSFGARLVRQGP